MNLFGKKREKIPTNRLPRLFSLYLRILCAGYLLYTVDSLIKNDAIGQAETQNIKLFFIIAALMFTIIGVIMFATSVYNLAIGKYIGGKLDAGYDENDTEPGVVKTVNAEEIKESDEEKATVEETVTDSANNSLTAVMMQSDLMRDNEDE